MTGRGTCSAMRLSICERNYASPRPGGERKLLRKYGAFGLLAIDERLLESPGELLRGMLPGLFELRYGGGVDRPARAVQKEGLAPEARQRRACGRDHGPHRPQRRLARDGWHEHAAGDGRKGAVA